MRLLQRALPLLWLLALAHLAAPQTPDRAALKAAAHDLCPREIAMLGESGTHGDGQTEAFKVALVEQLVDHCGFDQVLFEASHYEFIHLSQLLRAGQPVAADQLSAAVGGLWKFDRQFQPLVPFLLAKAQAGKLSLGGIDDQPGQLGQDYANVTMISELTGLLPQPRRNECALAFHRRIFSDYPDPALGILADRPVIESCLAALQSAPAGSDQPGPDQREMLNALQRWNARAYPPDASYGEGRDRSMYLNFQWLLQQPPHRHKTILWAATVHLANQGSPGKTGRSSPNFGSYVHQQFGERAFSLGFAALAGTYREARNTIRTMPEAPSGSLEVLALRGTPADAVYLGPDRLSALGTLPGAIFQHTYQTLPWATYVDGVVVFRRQQPPDSNR